MVSETVTYLSPGPERAEDIARDPRRYGVPPHHPVMTSFLGAPVMVKGRSVALPPPPVAARLIDINATFQAPGAPRPARVLCASGPRGEMAEAVALALRSAPPGAARSGSAGDVFLDSDDPDESTAGFRVVFAWKGAGGL